MAASKDDDKDICQVNNCSKVSARSISAKKVKGAGIDIDFNRGKAHLCKDHYKEFKKKTKEERALQRAAWS